MRSVCFGCDVVIEADDADAIADGFVAHAGDAHDWSYPEQSLRNYARNTAEAVERLSDETDRVEVLGDVTVYPVTEDRIDDWLRFFDHIGFAGNPDWASCYCLEPHLDKSDQEAELERYWRDSRSMMVDRLRTGGTYGYLAYVDGEPAGWVNASPRSDYGLYRLVDPDGPDPSSVIGVSCFVVAPSYRRHGIAAQLLDQVIADAADRGASWIEAYPFTDAEVGGAQHFYRGPRSLFDSRGFLPVDERDRDTIVRRSVTRDS